MLRISIKEYLEDIGYDVDDFSDGEEAYDAIYNGGYSLLILDVNVPSLSGFDLLQTIRSEGIMTPTIFLTAMTNIENLKEGYKRGCCDYMRKPFDLEELGIRIEQVFSSMYSEDITEIQLAEELKYCMTQGKLTYLNNEILLRKMEKQILEILIKYKNNIVSLQTMQSEIWSDYVEPSAIRVQIKNLRQKIPADIIQNRRGEGYIIERQ
jgi:DNA-binding response OmpR family regulator